MFVFFLSLMWCDYKLTSLEVSLLLVQSSNRAVVPLQDIKMDIKIKTIKWNLSPRKAVFFFQSAFICLGFFITAGTKQVRQRTWQERKSQREKFMNVKNDWFLIGAKCVHLLWSSSSFMTISNNHEWGMKHNGACSYRKTINDVPRMVRLDDYFSNNSSSWSVLFQFILQRFTNTSNFFIHIIFLSIYNYL